MVSGILYHRITLSCRKNCFSTLIRAHYVPSDYDLRGALLHHFFDHVLLPYNSYCLYTFDPTNIEKDSTYCAVSPIHGQPFGRLILH